MKNRRSTSREKMHSYYRRWESSGMSITSFAKSQGVPSSTFYYWCKKFSEQVNEDQPSNNAGFEPLSFSFSRDTAIADNPKAIIRFPTGVSVELYGTDSSELLDCLSSMSS